MFSLLLPFQSQYRCIEKGKLCPLKRQQTCCRGWESINKTARNLDYNITPAYDQYSCRPEPTELCVSGLLMNI